MLAPVLNKNVRYQLNDFVVLGPIGMLSLLVVARKDLPMNDVDSIIAELRKKPESISYGSPGVGTVQHLLMESLQSRAGVRMIHVPYKGASPLVNDVLGGQLDLAAMAPTTAMPYVDAGRLKVIGIASLQRNPTMKHIPTLNESKFVSGLETSGWFGLFAPRGVSPERATRLKSAMEAALADAAVSAKLSAMWMQVPTPAERRNFPEQIRKDEASARNINGSVK